MAEEIVAEKNTKRTLIKLGAFIGVVALIGAFALFFSSRLETQAQYRGGKVVGQAVPDVELQAIDGETIRLRDLAGKTVFVNFFNSWCVPCREEEPALAEFANQRKDDEDFVFIGIVRDDSRKNIEQWAASRDVPFIIAFDENESASIAFGTTGQPETYAIDRNGRVVASLLSRASVDTLNEMWMATR